MSNQSNAAGPIASITASLPSSNNTIYQIAIYIGICGTLILLILLIKYLVVRHYKNKMRTPWLIMGSKDAKKPLIIAQNPSDPNSIPLNRSDNEKNGSEFSYSLWFVIDNFNYRKGEWKHIFHKGNNPPYPNRAPGVWIHPNENAIRIYMNTYEKILDYVDIRNIPIKSWVHMTIILKEKILDIYINGTLKKRHILQSLPRQNFGDLLINLEGGFEGYISNMRYYQYALSYENVDKILLNGPSDDTCGEDKNLPGYLNNRWWLSE